MYVSPSYILETTVCTKEYKLSWPNPLIQNGCIWVLNFLLPVNYYWPEHQIRLIYLIALHPCNTNSAQLNATYISRFCNLTNSGCLAYIMHVNDNAWLSNTIHEGSITYMLLGQ